MLSFVKVLLVEIDMATSASLINLPEEIFLEILHFLPLSSIFQLGAVSKFLHEKIHQNESLWLRRVKHELKLVIIDPDYSGQICSDYWKFKPNGVIQDPLIQGAKETFLLYSKEYQTILRKKHSKSNSSIPYVNTILSMIPLNRQIDNHASKLALLGPGIESTRTKHLVHKLVNAHDDCLNVTGMVPSTTGGFGSAIQIDFKKLYCFELMCLYSNFRKIREGQKGQNRLLASHNRLLAKDINVTDPSNGPWLHENILKIFPILDGLIFAIDAHETDLVQVELEIFLESLDAIGSNMPILILYL